MTIYFMISKTPPKDPYLNWLISKILMRNEKFTKVEFFHVLRKHNKEADLQANLAYSLAQGLCKIGEASHLTHIP